MKYTILKLIIINFILFNFNFFLVYISIKSFFNSFNDFFLIILIIFLFVIIPYRKQKMKGKQMGTKIKQEVMADIMEYLKEKYL